MVLCRTFQTWKRPHAKRIRNKGIAFEKLEHVPVTTSDAAAGARGGRLAQGAKALIVKAGEQYYHLIISAAERVDNKKLRKILQTRRVRFANSEELVEHRIRKITNKTLFVAIPF